tara:strand:+ start:6452 stop:6847 length:396 start_codon:yes stop_codon:yes gene_type:complete
MYVTLYYTATGDIISSRKISQQQLDDFLETYSGTDYLEAYCVNVDKQRVDIDADPVVLVDKNITKDYTNWMRERRNLLLTTSDWTQGVDSPLTDAKKTEWQTYRTQLRALPTNYTDIITNRDDVNWPAKPD